MKIVPIRDFEWVSGIRMMFENYWVGYKHFYYLSMLNSPRLPQLLMNMVKE